MLLKLFFRSSSRYSPSKLVSIRYVCSIERGSLNGVNEGRQSISLSYIDDAVATLSHKHTQESERIDDVDDWLQKLQLFSFHSRSLSSVQDKKVIFNSCQSNSLHPSASARQNRSTTLARSFYDGKFQCHCDVCASTNFRCRTNGFCYVARVNLNGSKIVTQRWLTLKKKYLKSILAAELSECLKHKKTSKLPSLVAFVFKFSQSFMLQLSVVFQF